MSISPLVLRRRLMDALRYLEAMPVQSRHERHMLGKQLLDLAERHAWVPMLLKELEACTQETPKRLEAIGEILMEIGKVDELQTPLYAMVTRKDIADDVKDLIHIVLRALGDNSDPDFFFDNMKDPDGLMDRETARIFDMAEINPDAITEFLDAFEEMDLEQSLELMDNLQRNIPAKTLVRFALPMFLSQPRALAMELWCIDVLGNSGDAQAAWAILNRDKHNAILTHPDVQKARRLALKKLQMAGAYSPSNPDKMNDALNKTPLWHLNIEKQEAYATIPNGIGSQAIVLVNHWRSGDIGLMVIIGDDVSGFEQSLVYNYLDNAELNRWFIRFHDGEQRFATPLSYFKHKALLMEAKSFAASTPIPYEYTCWRGLLNTLEDTHLPSTERCKEWREERYTHETDALFDEPDLVDWHLNTEEAPGAMPLITLLQQAWQNTCGTLDAEQATSHPLLTLPDDPSPQRLVAFLDEWIVAMHTCLLESGFIRDKLASRLADLACLYGWTKQPKLAALAATEVAHLEQAPTDGRFFHEYLKRTALFAIGEAVEHSPDLQNEFDIFLPFLQQHWKKLPNID
jgi:hypothetical protein